MTNANVVILKTMDGMEFAVPREHLNASNLINKSDPKDPILCKHVSSLIMSKVVAFCSSNKVDGLNEKGEFDEQNFKPDPVQFEAFSQMENEVLLQLAMAANMLELAPLIHTVGAVIAKKCENKSPEEMAQMFDISKIGSMPSNDETAAEGVATTDSAAAGDKTEDKMDDNEDYWEEIEETKEEEEEAK